MTQKPVPTDKPKIQAYVEKEYKEAFEVLCKKRRRSVSNGVEWLIFQEVDNAIASGELSKNILSAQKAE